MNKVLLSIVEVARQTGLSSRTLRVWEEEGLLQSERDKNGIRNYDVDVFDIIGHILRLKELNVSLKDIKAILTSKSGNELREILSQKSEEINATLVNLLKTRATISRLETAFASGNSGDSNNTLASYLGNAGNLLEQCLTNLLTKAGKNNNAEYAEYMEEELQESPAEEVLQWLACLKKVRDAAEHSGFSPFLRGWASSSLLIYLTNWSRSSPLDEKLIPSSALRFSRDLHFDVPFSVDKEFCATLREANRASTVIKMTAFRSPVLDILSQWSPTGDPYDVLCESEQDLVTVLRDGDCEFIFCFDESSSAIINKIDPDISEEDMSPKQFGLDLRALSPTTKEDIFRFQALRRRRTQHVFRDFLAKRTLSQPPAKIATCLPEGNLGAPIFHEDILRCIKACTNWHWERCNKLRRSIIHRRPSEDIAEFIRLSDKAHFDYLATWIPLTFHRAHLVSWWEQTARTLSCRMKDRRRWEQSINAWESEHKIKWNDFGVALPHVSILNIE